MWPRSVQDITGRRDRRPSGGDRGEVHTVGLRPPVHVRRKRLRVATQCVWGLSEVKQGPLEQVVRSVQPVAKRMN